MWLASERKNSAVFIQWLKHLRSKYRRYRVIHVVCDNYIIHKSKKTLAAVPKMGCIELHFLPPYSPDYNPIDRLWGDLHAVVTRNHKHKKMTHLMEEVGGFLTAATPYPGARPTLAKAAWKMCCRPVIPYSNRARLFLGNWVTRQPTSSIRWGHSFSDATV